MRCYKLDRSLVRRLDSWVKGQSPRVSRTGVLEAALTEYLNKLEKRHAPRSHDAQRKR